MILAALASFVAAVVLGGLAGAASPTSWLGWLWGASLAASLALWFGVAAGLERLSRHPLTPLSTGALGALAAALHALFGARPAGLPLEGPLDELASARSSLALAGGLLALVQSQRLVRGNHRTPQLVGVALLVVSLAVLAPSATAAGVPWPGTVGLALVAASAAALVALRRR